LYLWLDLYAPYLALAALTAAVAALGWGFYQQRQLRTVQAQYTALTFDTDGGSLEQVLAGHLANVQAAREQAAQALEIARRAELFSGTHIQHVALLRYNPFSHTGSDQSFVLALADHHGNGAIVNSLHAREGTRIYAKPLAGWESVYTLTDEELEAIGKARAAPALTANGATNGNGKVTSHV
jgi:hypothetical protein